MNRRARLNHRANGISVTLVYRRLYHETAMLPFLLNDFRCFNWYVCEVLHKLFTPMQRAAVGELGVKVAGDRLWQTPSYLCDVREHGFRLSRHFPNLERVVVRPYYIRENPGGRVRGIIEDKRMCLTEWLMKGEKEGFEVEFVDLNRVVGGVSC